jgi:glycosyltransferase involved in cell wall biosynthesis
MSHSSQLTALKVWGPFQGPSGYDHHVRAFVRELVRQGIDVELQDAPQWSATRLPPDMRDPWYGSLTRPTGARVVLHFLMPHQVVPEEGKVNANYTMFEATRISPDWVTRHQAHDLVILPTESSRQAWVQSGVPEEKIRLCPLGIDPDRFSGRAVPMELIDDSDESLNGFKVRFLNVSEVGPRKNHVGLLRAWIRATSHHDDALLILKLGFYSPDWSQVFHRQMRMAQREVGKNLADAAPILIIQDIFSDDDMPRLFAAATHYISMSFGEGWDQTMVEAAASGLQLIAPNHSAYTTYLDPTVADLLPCCEVPAIFHGGDRIGTLFDNAAWWQPDEDAAIAAIRAAIDGTAPPKASARDRILRDFTWERATTRLITLLSDVAPKRRRFWPRRLSYRSG